MVVAPSTSVEERRLLRELQRKLKHLDGEIKRLRAAGNAESLRVSQEHLQTREAVGQRTAIFATVLTVVLV
jgi:uncharacterized coiled-coil DUF342 family protein